MKKLTGKKKKMYDNLIETLGNVTKSAERTGIERTTHYLWLRKDSNYKDWIDNIEDHQVDFYETALHQLIKDKNPTAVIFALKCKGKKRGYVERQEIEHSGKVTENKTLNVRFIGVEDVEGDENEKQEHTN